MIKDIFSLYHNEFNQKIEIKIIKISNKIFCNISKFFLKLSKYSL